MEAPAVVPVVAPVAEVTPAVATPLAHAAGVALGSAALGGCAPAMGSVGLESFR